VFCNQPELDIFLLMCFLASLNFIYFLSHVFCDQPELDIFLHMHFATSLNFIFSDICFVTSLNVYVFLHMCLITSLNFIFSVCGLIILVTAIILGKLFISRKWRIDRGRPRRPPQQCMQTCSGMHF